MALRFWDMDHTLIDNDCDVSWKSFLIAKGRAEPDAEERADFFYQQYLRAELDVDAFLAFQLAEFRGRTPEEMAVWCQEHFEEVVRPCIYPRAAALVAAQQAAGEPLCLLTATNRAIAAPLAAHLGFEIVLATELQVEGGTYTGRIGGTYCYGEGKVAHLTGCCQALRAEPTDAWYYGDSTSDIPVLQAVGHPVAVNPKPALREIAEARGWEILDFTSPVADGV